MDTSYLEKQVSTIINKLHELFDEIGVPSHDRDSRESELFAALSETLHNQLRLVTNEKHSLTEEAEKLITTIKQMHASLEGNSSSYNYEAELRVTYPLKACLQVLKERHLSISKLHNERYEQVKKLALAIESYSSHLEPAFSRVQLPPLGANTSIPPTFDLSHTYFSALDDEFSRVYDEYQRRANTVGTFATEMVTLWAELGTPQAQTDSNIVEFGREAPEQLGLHTEDISRLKAKRDKLVEEKRSREKRLRDVRAQIEQLWERLCIPEDEQKQFLGRNRGCGMRTINEFEDEFGRLNELKKQNLGLFVEEARIRLQGLWDGLYFSEEEMLEFTPAFSDVYSDALLSAHESEIERLEALKQQRAPILELVDRHKTLIKERDDLQASSQDASRLMLRGQKGEKRDPGKLLREEKMRKRITKELPKVEAEIKRGMEAWEEEYGRPFLVFGDRYLDEIESQAKVAPPPRSKTPSNMSHGRSNSKSSAAPSRAGTVKGASQTGLRSKTPTNFNTIRGNPLSQSTMHKSTASKGNISPSRIPSRAPLSSTTGNNSPDRKYMTIAGHMVDEPSRPVKNMGPPRLPPPKMKDLFVPPASATPTLLSRSTAELERSASIVRQIAPEDPYDDLNQRSAMSRSAYYHPSSTSHRSVASVASSSSSVENNPPSNNHHSSSSHYHNDRLYSHAPAPPSRPESRQISGTSNASSQAISAASGSENWETLDEGGSEMEADAIETYYAKLRAQQHHQALARAKRASPECGWAEGPGKRVRASPMLGATARGVVDGIDEAGWEDDDGY